MTSTSGAQLTRSTPLTPSFKSFPSVSLLLYHSLPESIDYILCVCLLFLFTYVLWSTSDNPSTKVLHHFRQTPLHSLFQTNSLLLCSHVRCQQGLLLVSWFCSLLTCSCADVDILASLLWSPRATRPRANTRPSMA